MSLCGAFPTLFDLVDASSSGELDAVAEERYVEVVDQCYLCDVCYMAKCPYVPPHPWNVDFPHLMLRAKAAHFARQAPPPVRDRLLSSTDRIGSFATIPVVVQVVNAAANRSRARRWYREDAGGHPRTVAAVYASRTFRSSAAGSALDARCATASARPARSRCSPPAT